MSIMPNEYQYNALFTSPEFSSDKERLTCSAWGLSGEVGEYVDILKKHLYQGHELDRDHMISELGDILWYVALGCTALGIRMEDVMVINNEKLRNRYPNGFTVKNSTDRREGDI